MNRFIYTLFSVIVGTALGLTVYVTLFDPF